MPINYEKIKNTNVVFGGTDAINVPSGAAIVTGEVGQLRYNTDTNTLEQYNSNGWSAFAIPPLVTNQSGIINQNTNSTITVLGANFVNGATIYVTGDGVGNIDRALTTTFVSAGELTAPTAANSVNYTPGQLYGIKVINPDSREGHLNPAGTIDQDPLWVTAAGSLGTFQSGSYFNVAVEASDSDNDTIIYSLVGGSLPTGITLNSSSGIISGVPGIETSTTTYSPIIRATSNNQTTNRTFNITIAPIPTVTSVSPYGIAGGSSVTITGTNLGNVTGVSIGGTDCTGVSASSTQVTALWPDNESRNLNDVLDLTLTANGVNTTYPGKFYYEPLFGTAKLGAATTSGTLNSYASMTSSAVGTGNNSATFDTTSGFSVGDTVLIIQTQDGTATSQPGNFEEKTISNISGTTVTFTSNFTKGYNSNTRNSNPARVTQMVRIAEYSNLTLNGNVTATSWNGSSGGVIAIKCTGTLNCNGNTITAAERGFRGGEYGPGNNDGGFGGEGRFGYDTTRHSSGTSTGEDPIAGGGGEAGPAASLGGCGAGGGSHATSGGVGTRNNGTTIAQPGNTYGNQTLENELNFGGAGGGGGDNDNQGGTPVNAGEGGGIVYVFANTITNGRFSANGRTHVQDPVQGSCGPAVNGSGAGGSIWIKSNNCTLVSCTATGGARVQNNGDCNGDGQNHPNGGAGGNGRIRIDGTVSGSSSPAYYSGSLPGGVDK